jgi:hypothetical protein
MGKFSRSGHDGPQAFPELKVRIPSASKSVDTLEQILAQIKRQCDSRQKEYESRGCELSVLDGRLEAVEDLHDPHGCYDFWRSDGDTFLLMVENTVKAFATFKSNISLLYLRCICESQSVE